MLAGVFSFVSELTERLGDWASNWWFLAVIGVIAFLDSVVPIVPSETTVIVGGVAVSTGEAAYPLWSVIVVGAVGAFLGDNTAYSIGHRFADRFQRRAERKPEFAVKLRWARDQIRQRGGLLLITARFVPGGRTVLTVSSGITRQSRWWFVRWIAVAVVIWASYAAGLAYVVGKPFKDNHTAAFWVAFGTAMTINVVIEVVRHLRQRRRQHKEIAPELA
jgi:membrane protein DedA with SNARE-associated domain